MTADVALWLDLAESNQMDEGVVRERVPPGAPVLRLTQYGASPCPGGTPARWAPVLDAIDRLVRDARTLERQSPGCRFWVTGRAGLPAFFYLGYRLSKMAAVTLVHQARNSAVVEELRLDASPAAAGTPYFARTPWPVPRGQALGPAALVVSSLRQPVDEQIDAAMAERRTRVAGIAHAHATERLDASKIPSALREIDELIQGVCDAHPLRSTLAVFVAGPSTLAFLVGAAINPRACRDVQMFEFDGSRYSLAYVLPYPSIPDRNKVLFFAASPESAPRLALDEEIRALRQELATSGGADRLSLEDVPSAQGQDVFHALRLRSPGAVHFSGHGETGELLFQDDRGALRAVSTADLAETVRLAGNSVRLVVLGACHSDSHADALLAHVECVVTVRGRIDDADARRFSIAFYRHLADGDSVRDAFDSGLLAMRLARPATPRGSPTRDVHGGAGGPGPDDEPLVLRERDPGCARNVFLVSRRP